MIAWIGTAMFVALALGVPLSSLQYATWAFASIGWATLSGGAATWLLIAAVPAIRPAPQRRKGALQVLKAVWTPRLAMVFASLAYGIMMAFLHRIRRRPDGGARVLRPAAGIASAARGPR